MRVEADVHFAVIPEWVLEARISATAVRIYGLLMRYADKQGTAYPSRSTLAKRANTSRSTVNRCLDELQRIGAVTVEHRRTSEGDQDTNLYRLRTTPLSRDGQGGPQTDQGWSAGDTRGGPLVTPELKPTERKPVERKKISRPTPPDLAAFEKFWGECPRKVGKKAAVRAFAKRVGEGASPDELVAGVQRYAAWVAAGGVESMRFVCHPATWLNEGREEDDLPDPASMDGGSKVKRAFGRYRQLYGAGE